MSVRRTFYTRQEAARLCRRSQWTLIRWEKEGLLTKLSDPSDPSGRHVRYAGPEVEALARRLRRLEEDGAVDAESEQGRIPRERESSRPKVPRRRRPPPPRSLTPAETSAQALPRSTPKQAATAPPRPQGPVQPSLQPPPRSLASHAPLPWDMEAVQWAREIDERKRAWEVAQTGTSNGRDDPPPSSSSQR